MMLLPLTSWPSLLTETSHGNLLASWTNLVAARAWSPSSFLIRSVRSAVSRSATSVPPIDIAMPDQDVPVAAEPPAQLLDDRHRAMAAAGAPDGDGHVQLALVLELGQREA